MCVCAHECVCVCVCVCLYHVREREREPEKARERARHCSVCVCVCVCECVCVRVCVVCQLIPWERIVSLAHLGKLSWDARSDAAVPWFRWMAEQGSTTTAGPCQLYPACVPQMPQCARLGYAPGAFHQRLIMAHVCFCAVVNCIFIRDVGEGVVHLLQNKTAN